MKKVLMIVSLALGACGGTVADIDGGSDAAADHVTNDGDQLSFSCGTSMCNGSDAVCVHPCCGGAMMCAALEDGGACPSGLQLSQQCPPQMPCTNVCTPPPPYCATTKDCSMVQGHDCYLMCQ